MAVLAKQTKDGKNISIDTQKLVETRMLVQANSGGGKSYLIRKLLEETSGKVQQIVLDIEGEFASLREEYDFILAGKGGDIPASSDTADLLARKTLELGVSLIVDLYELRMHERIAFVQAFLDSLMNAPKELWHPVLVVIDEAHIFCPEKGEAISAASVIDLASRGRKRGFCAVLATQRLSKLKKDVAAELQNKMIGRTSLDIDRKRAGDELGFLSVRDSLALRQLEPGEFYFFGPAISTEVLLGKVDKVKTNHPKAGHRIGMRQTAPTAKVKAALLKLTEIPKEAEEERQTVDTLKRQVRELKGELSRAQASQKVDHGAIDREVRKAESRMLERFIAAAQIAHKQLITSIKTGEVRPATLVQGPRIETLVAQVKIPAGTAVANVTPTGRRSKQVAMGERVFGACDRKILGFLATWPGRPFSRAQIGAMTGYAHGSGGFNNALSNLTQAGLIVRHSNAHISLAPDADVGHLVDRVPHSLKDWLGKLGACERAIYDRLLSEPETTWSREEIAAQTGYAPNSGGFNNALSRLNTLGLMNRAGPGQLRLNPDIAEFHHG